MTKTTQAPNVYNLCTPEQHTQAHKTKPNILLALGTGPHGKTALLEFPEGWQRTIDLPNQSDAWHPLFDDLTKADKYSLLDHARAPFVAHDDGTQSRPSPLSFVREVQTERGKFQKFTYFDVPAEKSHEGAVTGYRCAAELLEALEPGHGPHIMLGHVLKEAIEANKEGYCGTSRCAAAASFLGIVTDSLRFFARHVDHREYLSKKITQAEDYKAREAERLAGDRAEFVARMKAGKAAKRQAREPADLADAGNVLALKGGAV